MNKTIRNIVILVGFSLPYVFLAMLEDLKFGSMWIYGFMIVILIILTRYALRCGSFIPQLIGNIISYLGSYYFISLQEGDMWGWYFKPLSAIGLLKLVTVLIVLPQAISWILSKLRNHSRRGDTNSL